MTRLIGLVVLAQLALIALLYLSFRSLEQKVDMALQPAGPVAAVGGLEAAPGDPASPAPAAAGLDIATLRRIIREELRAARPAESIAAEPQAGAAEQPVYDDTDMQRRQERIWADMDYLRAQDEVSSAELDLLLAEIARLDPARRTEMLGELSRAMNRGEIKGRF